MSLLLAWCSPHPFTDVHSHPPHSLWGLLYISASELTGEHLNSGTHPPWCSTEHCPTSFSLGSFLPVHALFCVDFIPCFKSKLFHSSLYLMLVNALWLLSIFHFLCNLRTLLPVKYHILLVYILADIFPWLSQSTWILWNYLFLCFAHSQF